MDTNKSYQPNRSYETWLRVDSKFIPTKAKCCRVASDEHRIKFQRKGVFWKFWIQFLRKMMLKEGTVSISRKYISLFIRRAVHMEDRRFDLNILLHENQSSSILETIDVNIKYSHFTPYDFRYPNIHVLSRVVYISSYCSKFS